jgi:predicted MPP superfamily phosphohydrolase
LNRSTAFVLIVVIYTLLNIYIGWNGWVWLQTLVSLQQPWLYISVWFILAYAYLVGRFYRPLAFLRVIGASWFAFFQYALLLLPLANLTVLIIPLLFHVSRETVIFWTGCVILLTLFVLGCVGVYQAYRPVVREYTITLTRPSGTKATVQNKTTEEKASDSRSAYRLVIASDMHFGWLSGRKHAERLVQLINECHPDAVLLAGDIIDDDPYPFVRKRIGEVLRRLQAPLGVYGVLGNHEYYGGEIPAFLQEMERIGIKMLLDEAVELNEQIYIVGRKDRTDQQRKPIDELLQGLDRARVIILMDHQPSALDEALQAGADLYVAGHTHRGQMAPNHLLTRRMYELDWGYKLKQQMHVIVSSGYGFWGPPIRIGSRSEIIQLDLSVEQQCISSSVN